MQYVSTAEPSGECIFCAEFTAEPGKPLYRTSLTVVMLNAFPYNTGHVMVAPGRHVAVLNELTQDERHDLIEVTNLATTVIGGALKPDGFNVGMNLGTIAGAGIPGHAHVHVVPRWEGDTNFMPVVAETKVLPEMLATTESKLKPLFARQAPS